MRRTPTPGRPLTVAHRAGNSPVLLAQACRAGVDLVEADVHAANGRLEVRHLKTMGPLPLLWDRWRLTPGWAPRLGLAGLLSGLPVDCEIMLDLKDDLASSLDLLLDACGRLLGEREYSVCSQRWSLLAPFHERPSVRVVHSVGSSRLLRDVIPHLERHPGDAISINKKLLSPEVVRDLTRRVSLVMAWPVNRLDDARTLQAWGVNGIISDDPAILAQVAHNSR